MLIVQGNMEKFPDIFQESPLTLDWILKNIGDVLASGTPAEIKESVRRNCDIFMKDGGFVFNQVHNIVDGVPPENIIAMYDAVNTF